METIIQIKSKLQAADMEELPRLLNKLQEDSRQGVQKLICQYRRKLGQQQKEYDRIVQMKVFEQNFLQGRIGAGIDEAGRGPLAGPVVAAAVILPQDCKLLYINDSKKLSEARREELYPFIMEQAVSVGVGIESPSVIDEVNILQATYRAMRKAVLQLNPKPEILLNDAVKIPELPYEQKAIIHGDACCYSIAAASIIAKVTRDRMMYEYDQLYPEYGFSAHKGYGSSAHIQALQKFGPCPIHRKTFIKNFI